MAKNNILMICLAAVVLVLAVGIVWYNRGEKAGAEDVLAKEDALENVSAESGGNPVIQTADVTETATFYPVVVDGTKMEVPAIRDSAGEIRTAFNTCQSCYTSGNGRYEADGTEIVCQNCGFHFAADAVGIETGGGCNPWPITDADKTVTADTIEISYDFPVKSKGIFANWGKTVR